MNFIDPDDEEQLAALIGEHLHTILRKLPDEPYLLGVDLARVIVAWANDPGEGWA